MGLFFTETAVILKPTPPPTTEMQVGDEDSDPSSL